MRGGPVACSSRAAVRSVCLRVAVIMLALGLSACATHEATLDPQLFGAAPETDMVRSTGAVRIRMSSVQSNLVVTAGGLGGFDSHQVRTRAGEIVAAAAQLAFEHEFATVETELEGAAQSAATEALAAPWKVIVVPGAIRFDFRDDFVYFIPLGPLSMERRDVTVRLALEVQVVDEGGATRWSRSYDAGRELWKPRRGGMGLIPTEDSAAGVRRLAHEQAYRLLRRAAQDVRQWAEAERGRERLL
jgi:hypothetical protein